jgi:hypothetical protein
VLVKRALERRGTALSFDNPHARKAYTAHRTTAGDPIVDIASL